jgi:hypothetical protein
MEPEQETYEAAVIRLLGQLEHNTGVVRAWIRFWSVLSIVAAILSVIGYAVASNQHRGY